MCPPHEACAVQDMFCFAALADATLGTMYTNITGAFLVWLFKNVQYIFVMYIYDLNPIIVRPMPSCINASFIAPFSKVFAILRACDYQPALNMMDNECSKAVEEHIQANKMETHLVPPHNHRVNAAEHAIATFKELFVAALATVTALGQISTTSQTYTQPFTFLLPQPSNFNQPGTLWPVQFQQDTPCPSQDKSTGLQQSCNKSLLGAACN
jgi:hypothetical protein